MGVIFNEQTNTITIPRSSGATYSINGEPVKGSVVIDEETTVKAEPKPPSRFREGAQTEWTFTPGVAVSDTTSVVEETAASPESLE